jgi:hypothetical protein
MRCKAISTAARWLASQCSRDPLRIPSFGHVQWSTQGVGLSIESFAWQGAFITSRFTDPVVNLIARLFDGAQCSWISDSTTLLPGTF